MGRRNQKDQIQGASMLLGCLRIDCKGTPSTTMVKKRKRNHPAASNHTTTGICRFRGERFSSCAAWAFRKSIFAVTWELRSFKGDVVNLPAKCGVWALEELIAIAPPWGTAKGMLRGASIAQLPVVVAPNQQENKQRMYKYIYIIYIVTFHHTGICSHCSQSHCQPCCDRPVVRSSYMLLLSTLSRCQIIGVLRNEFAAKQNSKVSPQMLHCACVHWTWSLCTNRNPEVADANPCVSTLKSNLRKLQSCEIVWS